jgi:DNA-binding transcriptional ArsR family regulator
MADSPGSLPAAPAPGAVYHWRADVVFPILADPSRRQLLAALANGIPMAASQLASPAGRRLDATLKHLTALRASALVVTMDDPRDGRRQLYYLSPNLTVRFRDGEGEIDFGCCVLRVGKP